MNTKNLIEKIRKNIDKKFYINDFKVYKERYEEWEIYLLKTLTNGYIYDFSLLYIYMYIDLIDITIYYI